MAINPKQFPSEIQTIKRSEITICGYNPRYISDEGRKALKRSLKKYGVLGGIIINKRNHPDFDPGESNVVCSGNQKVAILDAVNKYSPDNPESDYELRVEMVDVDAKTEREIVVVMNNQAVGGDWDYDKLRQLIPDIDYKNVGFTDADLSIIGVDFMFQTEQENDIANALSDLMTPVDDRHQEELMRRRAERDAQRQQELGIDGDNVDYDTPEEEPITREERIDAVKNMKKQIMDDAIAKAADMDAYFTISFNTWKAKAEFLANWGYDPRSRFIKGEDFAERLDGVEVEDE